MSERGREKTRTAGTSTPQANRGNKHTQGRGMSAGGPTQHPRTGQGAGGAHRDT